MHLPGRDFRWKKFLVALKDEYQKDNVSDAAGAVTFNGLLALFPFLLFLIALAGAVITPAQAESAITAMAKVAPPEAVKLVGDRIRSLLSGQHAGLLSVGALLALWAASSGVMALARQLNIVYGVRESRPFWKVRLIALGMTLLCGVLGIAALVAAVAAGPITHALPHSIGVLVAWLRFPAAALLMMLIWALFFWALPNVKQRFKFITPGSVVGVLVWIIASVGFSLYVENFGKYDATYGSLGGVIVLLVWMWISAQVMLIAAEANALIEQWSPEGKDEGEKEPGKPMPMRSPKDARPGLRPREV